MLIKILLALLVILSAGFLFVLILIWRALLGRSIVNAQLSGQLAVFSHKLSVYTKSISGVGDSVDVLNKNTIDLARRVENATNKINAYEPGAKNSKH